MAAARSLDTLPPWARELLESERVAHLGLVDDERRPRVLPVTFAVVDGAVWSAIDDKPKRVPARQLARLRWAQARPAVALTVDRYDDDWTRLAWVQLLGQITIVELEGRDGVLHALAARYPSYQRRAPGGPLLRLEPERALSWRADD
jgi:PPOX class probable F420-dependent enzyme